MTAERGSKQSGQHVRLDRAHRTHGDAEVRDNPVAPEPPQTLVDLQQMRNQASQLATHLDAMREDVDRREAELNAREASAEKEMRAARLWLHQREQELAERAEEMDLRERKLSESEASIEQVVAESKVTAASDNKLSDKVAAAVTNLREQRLRQEEELRRQQQQVDLRRRASLALVKQLLDGVERRRKSNEIECQRREKQLLAIKQDAFRADYQKAADQFVARQKYLDEAEAMLANGQADLEVQQEQLKQQRERGENQLRALRRQSALQQRQQETQWQQRQDALARRSEQLDSRQAGIEQTRQEVAAMHREALELRLATEELWAKLSQIAPAPALTGELGRIRRRLAESYCLERNAAVQEKQHLEATQKRLADHYIKLNAEKKELHDWVSRREQDVETQAARLVAREQELDRQESEHREMLKKWQNDRRAYQDRIRKLTKDLRSLQPSQQLATA